MKKMKLAVVFTAFVSVFGLSSCLDSGESGPQTANLMVTVGNHMGIPVFYPDCMPGYTLDPSAVDLSQYGISSSARRALITYTLVEGQPEDAKNLKINLVAGGCVEIKPMHISENPDTFDTKGYISAIKKFEYVQPFYPYYPVYPKIYAENGFLTIGFSYAADKVGSFGLMPDRVSNDTLYLDLRAKTEGSSREGIHWMTYALDGQAYNEVQPVKDDSIRITVQAKSSLESAVEEKTILVTTAYKKY